MNDLAYFYASATDATLRDKTRAVELAERSVERGGEENPAVLDTLAAAYVGVGEFEKAAGAMDKALILLEKSAASEDVRARYRTRLERIENGQRLAE